MAASCVARCLDLSELFSLGCQLAWYWLHGEKLRLAISDLQVKSLCHCLQTTVGRDVGDASTCGLKLIECGAHFGDVLVFLGGEAVLVADLGWRWCWCRFGVALVLVLLMV